MCDDKNKENKLHKPKAATTILCYFSKYNFGVKMYENIGLSSFEGKIILIN
jgi:hypothetical protein